MNLTERQKREKDYYQQYSLLRDPPSDIDFEPILGKERRPWNPYWRVYEHVGDIFDPKNCKLLDFGCGMGISSIRFAKLGYQVYAFDISDANISTAVQLSKRYGVGNRIQFSVQTSESLDYPSDFFDIAVGIDILHHVQIADSITQCHRVLKKGGRAIFKEHIQSTLFDTIRESRIIKSIYPKTASFDNHITNDERKLNSHEINLICNTFSSFTLEHFTLISRLDLLLRNPDEVKPSPLEIIDQKLISIVPSLYQFCGTVLFNLIK